MLLAVLERSAAEADGGYREDDQLSEEEGEEEGDEDEEESGSE